MEPISTPEFELEFDGEKIWTGQWSDGIHHLEFESTVGHHTVKLGEISRVDSEIESYARLANNLQQPMRQWQAIHFQAMRALLRGQFHEVERLGQQILEVGQRAHDPAAPTFYAILLLAMRREQARLEELEPLFRIAVDSYPGLPVYRCALSYLYSQPQCGGNVTRVKAWDTRCTYDASKRLPSCQFDE